MIRIFSLVFLCLSFKTFAIIPEPFYAMKCRPQVESILKKYQMKDKWDVSDAKAFSFKTPTKTFGTWLELKASKSPEISVLSSKQTQTYQWDSKCVLIRNTSGAALKFLNRKIDGLTDEKLKVLVHGSKLTLIHFIFNEEMKAKAQKIAREMNLEFAPFSAEKLQSIELYMRGGNSFIVGKGRISKGLSELSKEVFLDELAVINRREL